MENQYLTMYNETLFYDLVLSFAKGIGPVNTRKLLNYFGSSKELCIAKNNKLSQLGVSKKLISSLKLPDNLRKAEKEMKYLESRKILTVRYTDEVFPNRLKNCHDAPF